MELKLSENIKSLRIKKNLTQKELAIALAVSPQTVSRWEKGGAFPDVLMLEKLASFFGITIDALVGRGAEYVAGLRRQLRDLRQRNPQFSPAVALEECAVYEKLALAGFEQVSYYTALVHYKTREDRFKGYAAEEAALEERIASARALVKAYLKNCPADLQLKELGRIFCMDEQEGLAEFAELVPTDFEHINYSDLLLMRYRTGNDDEQFEKELQYNCYRRVSALLYTLANGRCVKDHKKRMVRYGELHPVSYYEIMLDTLQAYSKKEWDLFLPQRALILVNYAASLFKDDREEEGFLMLEKLKKTVLLAEKSYLKGEKMRGSVPLLADVYEEQPLYFFGRMMDIVADGGQMPEFAPFKDDVRFKAFFDLWQEVSSRVCAASLKKEELCDLRLLFKEGEKEFARHRGENAVMEQVLVLKCVDGRVLCYYSDYGKDPDETALSALLEKDRPHVKRMVCLWKAGVTDLSSYAFRKKLIDLHPENENAEIFLQGHYKYTLKKLSVTMPVNKG